MKIRNVLAVVALSLAFAGCAWSDNPCNCKCNGSGNCGRDGGGSCVARVGAGVPGEKIDFSEKAVFIEDIAVYDSQVTVNEKNQVVDALGNPAKPLTEFNLRDDNAQVGFKVIGRDTKGKYKELADDAHTCVGWVNNVDYSEHVKLGNANRTLHFISAYPGTMRLIVSYQTVPGSSTPIQRIFNVTCFGKVH